MRSLHSYRSLLFIMSLYLVFPTPAFVIMQLMKTQTIQSSGTISYYVSPLHIEGRYIKDAFSNIVILKGVQKHGFEDDAGGRWKDETHGATFNDFQESVVKRNLDVMKSWGCNEVRLVFRARFWLDNTVDMNGRPFRTIIKNFLSWADDRGIYVEFCPFSLEGSSDWHSVPWGTPTFPTLQDFINFWTSIATELSPYPNVMFELWNEIASGKETWFNGCNQTIQAIRSICDNIIVIQWDWDVWYREGQYADIATLDWVNDPRLQGTNILFSTHMYRDARGFYRYDNGTEVSYYQYSDVQKAFIAEKVQECVETWDKPLYIGEYGPDYTLSYPVPQTELQACDNGLTILDEWGISYNIMWWWSTYQNGAPYGFFLEDPIQGYIFYNNPAYITEWGNIAKNHI